MRFERLSEKQLEIFRFAHEPYTALICDGAVRTGKTILMGAAFLEWAMHRFAGMSFALCGKTVRSAERNLVEPLLALPSLRKKYALRYSRSLSVLTAEYRGRRSSFYVFGGRDESSYMLIQGMTLAGVLLDEAALMPRSFVEQAVTRTLSVEGARLWFNCNPAAPTHWFYREWILRAKERNAKRLHFLLEDNPGLSPRAIERAKQSFSGVFYERYIMGRWVAAEGLVYPRAAQGEGIVKDGDRPYTRFFVSVDYGTLNPCSMGLWGECGGVCTALPNITTAGVRAANSSRTRNTATRSSGWRAAAGWRRWWWTLRPPAFWRRCGGVACRCAAPTTPCWPASGTRRPPCTRGGSPCANRAPQRSGNFRSTAGTRRAARTGP